ncbi:MAG: HNH endonuclease signature motif containing protein [Bacteroidales bacterium]
MRTRLSTADLARFIELYPSKSNAELGIMFGVRESYMHHLGFKLRLFKSKEFIRERSSKGYFKPGCTPPNKGKKLHEFMSPERIEKFLKTSYRAGHTAVNRAAVGTEVITRDGYVRVKIAEPNIWKLKHRLVWERVHGEIPKGCNIQFHDRNSQNCSIENLYMISKSEQIHCNSIMRYPESLRESIHKIATINKLVSKAKHKS